MFCCIRPVLIIHSSSIDIRIQPTGCGCITATNALFSDFQPLLVIQLFGISETFRYRALVFRMFVLVGLSGSNSTVESVGFDL
jgi:hypothetical protein